QNGGMNTETDETAWLERTLTTDIPLGGAMALSVARLDDDGVELALPLEPNINDKGTAFGGALASAMILAGWSLPRLLIRRAGLSADLVIGRCETRFLVPVAGPFRARCPWPSAREIDRFVLKLERSGRAGLDLHPEIVAGSEVAATLSARYAALGGSTR
ncbi:MAG: YiiD C-terminal domain-containing protein, partial [Wenzhouxiangella sp.]